jgi:hypothetical protein
MSLVGSEVDVSMDNEYAMHACVSDDELSIQERQPQIQEDLHPPPSPPRGIERLFLNDLPTQGISAAALAQQIHMTHRQQSSVGWGGLSVNTMQTDDFVTAVGWVTAADESDSLFGDSSATPHLISARSDTLTPCAESDDDDNSHYNEHKFFKNDILSRNLTLTNSTRPKMASTPSTTPTSTPTPTKIFPTEVPEKLDAAEKVYGTVKGVWAWGKGVAIVTPFLGLAEAVAGKVVGMAGTNLEGVDGMVSQQLHTLDEKVLNPALVVILGAMLGAAGKTEDTFKPLIISILKPLGLIKETAENPELTTTPGVTVQ